MNTLTRSLAALAVLFTLLAVAASPPALAQSLVLDDAAASASVTPLRALGHIEASIGAAASETDVTTAGLAAAIAATLTEDAKLIAADGAEGDFFSARFAVALSGNRALIGAPTANIDGKINAGAAYVFAFDGAQWGLQAKLTASDAFKGDQFGESVALSGNRALIGAPQEGDDNNPDDNQRYGSVYVFTFDGTQWSQQTKISAPNAFRDPPSRFRNFFGGSVALSGDRALVGAAAESVPGIGIRAGSAWVFAFDGAQWGLQAQLTATDASPNDFFGSSVALSGNRALVSAPRSIFQFIDGRAPAVYVFTFDGAQWGQQAKLAASDGVVGDGFGNSVALSGNRALVGAPGDPLNTDIPGAAYVFAFDGTQWGQQAKLAADDGVTDGGFGFSVALSDDRALVGASRYDGISSGSGAAYVFAFDGTQWGQQAKLAASDGYGGDENLPGDSFGFSMAFSGDLALIGAPFDDNSRGSVYFFDLSNQPPVADAGPDQTVECTGPAGVEVTLNGSGSSDPNGDALSYSWSQDGTEIATGVTPTVTFAEGTHTITLTVTDPLGASDTDEVVVTVQDTTPPELTVSADPLVLTRPNHKYVTVSLADLGLTAADACDGTVDPGQVYVASVSSDEPEDAGDDGNTLDDIVVDDCRTVRVRAERDGTGNGRVYTITLAVADAAGNVGTATYEVQVPVGNNGEAAVPDGTVFTVDGCDPSAPAVAPPAAALASADVGPETAPAEFALSAAYPNPFNPTTTISFDLPEASFVTLSVYSILGQQVAQLVNEQKSPGRYTVSFDASTLSSGIYLYRLQTDSYMETMQMTLIK